LGNRFLQALFFEQPVSCLQALVQFLGLLQLVYQLSVGSRGFLGLPAVGEIDGVKMDEVLLRRLDYGNAEGTASRVGEFDVDGVAVPAGFNHRLSQRIRQGIKIVSLQV
jgi:hypothetical protein